jgi:hypothetical protein
MTTPTIIKRRDAGAAWLDKQRPGWWKPERFDLDKLDMTSGCCCVGGQVFDQDAQECDADTGYDILTALLDRRELEYGYGFLAEPRCGVMPGDLAAAWRELILARRAGRSA